MKSEVNKEVISWVKTIVFAVIFAMLINNFIIVNASVPTSSMESTIMPGDRIVAFRMSYVFSDPKRFDVVVFKFPDDEKKLFVKRIIGLPGETVEVKDGKVYINDELLEDDEKYIKEEAFFNSGPYLVPEDKYFMMGDNRNMSEDSRFWKNTFLSREKILGKVIFKYFPGFKSIS